MNTRRHLMLAAGATALAAQLPATASAQTFPSRPLRFIMPYPPGGSSEILARPIAQEMTKFFGQPVIVDFKPGAGSTIGANVFLMHSVPSGSLVVYEETQLKILDKAQRPAASEIEWFI